MTATGLAVFLFTLLFTLFLTPRSLARDSEDASLLLNLVVDACVDSVYPVVVRRRRRAPFLVLALHAGRRQQCRRFLTAVSNTARRGEHRITMQRDVHTARLDFYPFPAPRSRHDPRLHISAAGQARALIHTRRHSHTDRTASRG